MEDGGKEKKSEAVTKIQGRGRKKTEPLKRGQFSKFEKGKMSVWGKKTKRKFLETSQKNNRPCKKRGNCKARCLSGGGGEGGNLHKHELGGKRKQGLNYKH